MRSAITCLLFWLQKRYIQIHARCKLTSLHVWKDLQDCTKSDFCQKRGPQGVKWELGINCLMCAKREIPCTGTG